MINSAGKWGAYGLGTAAIIIFAVLLLIRLDIPGNLFHTGENPPVNNSAPDGETWMEITQQGQKIGYAFRKRNQTENGNEFSEDIFMSINTMGIVQPLRIQTSAALKAGGELASFRFSLSSNQFQFTAAGTVENGKMSVRVGPNDNLRVFSLPAPVYWGGGVIEAAGRGEWHNGQRRSFALFDPASLSSRQVVITCLGDESLPVMGKVVKARKLSVDFMGMKQVAWVSQEGIVLREEGIMGIALQMVSREEALSGLDGAAGSDLTVAAAIPSLTPIDNADTLKTLKIRLNNLPAGNFLLHGGRQTHQDGLLTISSEKYHKGGAVFPDDSEIIRSDLLKATPFIQSDNPKIRRKAAEIVAEADDPQAKAEKLVAWVYKNIAKRPVLSVPDAVQTLENGVGECNEHAVLLAALARAAGLPAEIETGLVYRRGSFFFHAWNIIYIKKLGGWVTADASFGQMPADVTHLRFARGSLESQADLAALIGRLKLEIVGMDR